MADYHRTTIRAGIITSTVIRSDTRMDRSNLLVALDDRCHCGTLFLKVMAAIDWLPKRNGCVAVSAVKNVNFDERVELSGQVRQLGLLYGNGNIMWLVKCTYVVPSEQTGMAAWSSILLIIITQTHLICMKGGLILSGLAFRL